MKTENLEALLIDRAMGELPAATVELLDEYLAQNRDAAKKSEILVDALVLAKRAMQPSVTKIPLPFPRELIQRENKTLRWQRGTLEIFKLAACFALGIVVVGLVKKKPSQESLANVPPIAAQPVVILPQPKNESNFWSVARLETEVKKRAMATQKVPVQYELHWNSPKQILDLEKKS